MQCYTRWRGLLARSHLAERRLQTPRRIADELMVKPNAPAAIREARQQDAGNVADLWTEAYVTLGVGGRTFPYTTADFRESKSHGRVFVVDKPDRVGSPGSGGIADTQSAESAGRGPRGVAGVVALLAPGAPGRVVADRDEAELSRLAVASSARGMGIGRALTRLCEERAREAGWSAIALWSRPRQVEAHRLYESLGYRRVPVRDSVDRTGHGRLVFRLALDR